MERDARSWKETEDTECRLEAYLRARVTDGEFYCKSKFVAREVGLTPSQVGQLLRQFQESLDDLVIEQWGYANATTWRVSRRE